ncbi:MAG: polysaccharide deacetylase family protein [Actinomycetota bacterium]|nr:polysaccharide deacetylase family protein [Actinomycetota bacterium]
MRGWRRHRAAGAALSLTLIALAACGSGPTGIHVAAAGYRAPVVRDGRLRVPILLYHHIGPVTGKWRSLYVSLPQFARQMKAIATSGAQTLSMDDLYDAVRNGRSYTSGAIALTFDDATEDQYTLAFPILKQYRLHATLFVPTGLVGRPGYVTWAQLSEMKRSGLLDVEAHSVSHVDLTQLTAHQVLRELRLSSSTLRRKIGVRARQFAYPFGKFDANLESLLRKAGYESAVTTRYQWSHPIRSPYEWGRMEVHDTNAPANLASLATMSGSWQA